MPRAAFCYAMPGIQLSHPETFTTCKKLAMTALPTVTKAQWSGTQAPWWRLGLIGSDCGSRVMTQAYLALLVQLALLWALEGD